MNDDRVDETARIVVVGAGQAGFSACAKLRELGHKGPLLLVGSEPHPPYQRPPLSKSYLLGETTEDRLYLRPLNFYEERGIELRLATVALRIDRNAQSVELSDGSTVQYDRLVLATGTRPRQLPDAIGGGLDGVFYVRSISDIAKMSCHFSEGRKVLIVGGGYIGLEAAAVSCKLGLQVTVVEAAERILQRVASRQTSDYFRALHSSHGVRLVEGTGLSTLTGRDGNATGAVLTDGTVVEADFVIVGIGVHANSELAGTAGLQVDNGIVVDAGCRTSDPSIFAAGDCASFPWKEGRIRLESVGNAIDQGEAVARTIMGLSTNYAAKPWFWSDQFDVKLQIAGLSTGHDQVVERPGAGGACSYWYYRAGDLLAVDAMNEPRVYMVAKRLIESGKSPSPELISDPRTDLKALMGT